MNLERGIATAVWMLIAMALAGLIASESGGNAPTPDKPGGFELWRWERGEALEAAAWDYQREGSPWLPVAAFTEQAGQMWGLIPEDPAERILRVRGRNDAPGASSEFSSPRCRSDLTGDRRVGIADWLVAVEQQQAVLREFGLICP